MAVKKNIVISFLLLTVLTSSPYLYYKYERLLAQNELVDFCSLVDLRQEISASEGKVIEEVDLMILTKIVQVQLRQDNLSKSETLLLSRRAQKLKDSWERVKPHWVEGSDKNYISQLAAMGKVDPSRAQ